MQISLIVPAYNEGKYIKKNLEILRKFPDFTEIIVADNASTDNTAEISKSVPGVQVHTWKKNLGKTKSVIRAVGIAKSPHIMLFDADLQNMKAEYIQDFLDTYRTGNYDMVIMDKGSQPFVFRHIFQSVPALSGTRICSKSDFEKIIFPGKRPFELEQTMNRYFLSNKKNIIEPELTKYTIRESM